MMCLEILYSSGHVAMLMNVTCTVHRKKMLEELNVTSATEERYTRKPILSLED